MKSLFPSNIDIQQFESDAATKEFLSTESSFLFGQEDRESRVSTDELELTTDDLKWLRTCFSIPDELPREVEELDPSVGNLFELITPIGCHRSPLQEVLYPYSVKPSTQFY
ncbi:hypothetical protein AMTR_s00007p00268000 [Amborella trichopoda]|uniref:Uncharacterized protein n=1 Tax=Amborella trichopoda TaxID=13333 RepID=W1PCZ2_AMBTC|nr:hypothetical protein AMTR_s00007p00268000 [Amborella trichopoda]